MRRMMVMLALVAVAGCSQQFRTPALNRQQALAHTEILEMRVVKVWNVVTDALDHDRDPAISHYVEVDVLAGPSAGQKLTLPLDHWSNKPPVEGSTVVAAPADWVKPNKNGTVRPFGGW